MPKIGPIFHTPKSMISKSIDYNNGTITSAKMTVIAIGTGNLTYYLSADGGANWETVTSGNTHFFTNTGTDLKWKIEGSGRTITSIIIEGYHI